jgi:peptidoglycan/LPS O-acetylase OafA/YrhL
MRIEKLDSLRGVFSIMVVLHHFDQAFMPDWFYQNFLIRQANFFVDFFFVLSGYIIARKYEGIKTRTDFTVYLKKRFIRLLPLLYYTTTLYLIIQLVFNIFFPYLLSTQESISTLLFAYLDTITFLNSTVVFNALYTSNVGNMGMNFPSWSISAELIIYIFFGTIIYFSFKYKWNRNQLFIFALIAAITFCAIKQQFNFTDNFGYVRGLISFILGYFVWNYTNTQTKWMANISIIVPPLIIAALYFLHQYEGYLYQMMALIIIPSVFAIAILLIIQSDGLLTNLLTTKPLLFLGKLSYSIYLNQILVITIVPHFLFQIFELQSTAFIQMLVLVCTFVVLILYSILTNQFIEVQLSKWIKNKLIPNAYLN